MSQDLRQHPRFPFRRQLTILAKEPKLGKTIGYDATGVNLSRGGILLESRADFETDTLCTLTFKDLQDQINTRTGAIRRVEKPDNSNLPDAIRLYGIEFDEPFSEEQLNSMMAMSEV
ncbi:MAG: PilZ domain-containing protein [Leptospiraceae bacterium]|nr:PilZ domain-containing protein [Leptospiraceae bacterium]